MPSCSLNSVERCLISSILRRLRAVNVDTDSAFSDSMAVDPSSLVYNVKPGTLVNVNPSGR